MTSRCWVLGCLLSMFACGGSPPPPPPPPATPAPSATAELPAPKTAEPGSPLTTEECQAAGGHVVGDIGDGAIHRPGYRCPGSGQPPIGKIKLPAGGPMPIEGAVCCR